MNLPLRQLAGNQLALKGAHGEQRIHLGVRLDEMVVRAHLNLAVTPSPALLPNLSHLQVRLNDKLLSVIPLRADHAGERIERRIELDPRLFVDDNWLSLRLVGHYTLACEDPLHSSLWADVDVDATGFELTIRPLALEDELALFPAPWFDRRSAGRVEVPMVLGLQPSQERLSTASIMASWLGSLAGERGASFPVRRDRLPDRHAIVLASPQQPLPEGLDVPEAQGPTVRLLRHPRLPHVKLLLLQGRNDRELRTAALGLILGRQAISGSSVLVNELGPIPARPPYDAPNWVATDKPVRLGELVPERSALQLQGAQPDAVRVRWRTPPDLWQSPGRSAVLNLRYRVAVASATDNALMSLSLNDSFVRAWRLAASPSSGALGGLGRWLGDADEASGSVRVKLPEFQPRHGNMLEVQLPLGTKPQAGDCAWRAETTRAAVDAESTLDFSALPHFMPMPDLAAFAVPVLRCPPVRTHRPARPVASASNGGAEPASRRLCRRQRRDACRAGSTSSLAAHRIQRLAATRTARKPRNPNPTGGALMNEFSPPRTARILIIDDSREMLDHLGMMLAPHYELSQAASGEAGLAMALERLPDLILLDVCMDGMDGYAVCERLKQQASTRHIPVVLMSAYIDTEGEARAFEVGASDCLRKPINERIAASRIQVQLSLKAAQDLNRDREAALEQEVRRRTEHIELTQHVALLALVNLARTRDTETGGHIVRTQAYVRMLAERLREHPRFSAELTPNAIRLMTQSAPLHDIGKIGIPDHILRKPGALTPEEMTIMRTHTTLGLRALEDAERLYDRRVDFLRYAKDIVIGHHERWDGKGYPYGLKGDAIPVAARLMAVADVFDALISKRVYKEAFPEQVAFDIIQQGSGSQFDPDIVNAFLDLSERFTEIVHIHRDGETSSVAT